MSRLWSKLVSPWSGLLLVLAALLVIWRVPHLPTNPRDGYSTVGVWFHGTHPGAPPGTPYVYGPYTMIIESHDGTFRAGLLGGTRRPEDDGWEQTGLVELYATRLREGLLAPTRETRGCTLRWIGVRDWRGSDTPVRQVPAEHRDRALVAMIEAFRTEGTMVGDVEMATVLEHHRAGRNPWSTRTMAEGVRANRVFLIAFALVLVALPGVVRALIMAGRRARRALLHAMTTESRCRYCGYRLRGLESERCPECGTPVAGAREHSE